MRIPILSYHGFNIGGGSYSSNDHVALRDDVRTINRLDLKIIPLRRVVSWILGEVSDAKVAGSVALTCDDGTDFDYHDLVHPVHGPQRSFANILRDFRAEVGEAQPEAEITSFVIASPQAREEMDRKCVFGKGWMDDAWWAEADKSGVMRIENHSWDHAHPEVSVVAHSRQVKGDFTQVASYADCSAQIAMSAAFIGHKLHRPGPMLFAYPWCQASSYAVEKYFPGHRAEHRTLAAFGGPSGYASRESCRWLVPRFFCGPDWHSPAQLETLLLAA